MQKEPIRFLVVAAGGLALWQFANAVLGTREPWDSPAYLGFYLGALGLSAGFGALYNERPWRWGLIVIFAQLPVMMLHKAVDPLLLVGFAFLAVSALPAIIAASLGSYFGKLRRRS
jgi:hypothetical protein